MENPIVKTKRGISPIWILPLVAIILIGYLIYKNEQESGIMVTVAIKDASGLTAGKTKVLFKGLPVGTLKGFSVSHDLKHIDAQIEMLKQSRDELLEDTLFWIVRPEISMNRITGLDTLVTGSYFEIQPGTSGKQTDTFTALTSPPPISTRVPGLHLTLHTPHEVSLTPGSPVYYKKIQVGEIISCLLLKNASIETKVLIYPEYVNHVSNSTKFFINSGISLHANLPNIEIKVDPIKTILRGGVSFFTPTGGKKLTEKTHSFQLYKNFQNATDANDIPIKLTFSVDHSLEPKAAIRYQGITIGMITDITIDANHETVHANAHIDQKMIAILTKDAYLWTVNAKFNAGGIANLDTLIRGSYVNIIPGKGKSSREFFVNDSRPANIIEKTGLNIVMETDRLGSLGYNKPVYYRQVNVGHTTGYELSHTGQTVLIYVNIHAPFVDLIRANTRFWNSSGIRIKGGLMTEMQINTESMAAIIGGGISFATPNKEAMGNRIATGKHFILHNDPEEEWLQWNPLLLLEENVPPKKAKPVKK